MDTTLLDYVVWSKILTDYMQFLIMTAGNFS